MLGTCMLLAGLVPQPAYAQHADAGAGHAAAAPPALPAEPSPSPTPDNPAPGNAPSGVLPKIINPNQLSEATRARLAERAAGRHASSLPTHEPGPGHEANEATAGAPSVTRYRPHLAGSEAFRRHQRMRVQAVETDEGVTLLSNRLQLPESRLSAAIARHPPPEPEPPVAKETVALADSPNVTETHSLRPMSSRTAKPKKDTSTGLGWLLWPFALFVTTSAVVGTLWFRKKTE